MGMRSRTAAAAGTAAMLLTLGIGAAAAQEATTRERVVALDPEHGITVLNADRRQELGLFPEVEGFVSATLLEPEQGSGWVLEIVMRRDTGTVRERRRLDAAALERLRGQVGVALQGMGLETAVDREGRGGVVLASTVMGLGYYGWALPDALGVTSDRGRLAGYLLTSGASFLVPYLVTRRHPVSRAQRNGVVWGATRGALTGSALGDLVGLGADNADNRDGWVNGLGVLGSVGTALVGHAYAGSVNDDVGKVALAGALGDFALAEGFGWAYALGLYDGTTRCDGDVCSTQETEATRTGHAFALGVGAVGTVAGALYARHRDVGQGDVRVLQSAGLLGAQAVAPLAAALLDEDDHGDDKVFAGMVLGGAALGLFVGDRYGMTGKLSPGDGLLVLAGHLAGGAGLLGVHYLLNDDASAQAYLATSALGSLLGSLLTYRAVRGRTGAEPDSAVPGGSTLEVHPLSLLQGLGRSGGRTSSAPLAPLLTIRF